MASAIAAVEVVVDSKTDPRQRPTNSNDPGWNYAYSTTIGNRDAVTCKLCGRSLRGGIRRLKEHLAGGYGDSNIFSPNICIWTTTENRKEMEEALEGENKRPSR